MSQQSPTLSRRSLVAIAATLTSGAAIGMRGVLAAPPDVAHLPTSQAGTPVATGESAIGALLNRAYDPGTGIASELSLIATFADLDLETAALGLTRPADDADERDIVRWMSRMPGLALPQDMAYFLTEEWALSTGFGPTQISQTVEIGEPPARVAMFSGAFDREMVINTWIDAGYNEIESDDEIAIYSISEDDSFSLDNPIQRVFLSRRNNVAILGNDLVIFTSTLDLLRDAISSALGEATTLGEAPGVAALFPNTPHLASGAFTSGSSLQSLPPICSSPESAATAIAEQQSQGQVPPILLALIGVTPGGPLPTGDISEEATPIPTPETATLEISLLMPSAEAAQQAIDVVGERLPTAMSYRINQPLTVYFKSWELSVSEDAPIARISIELQNSMPKIWMDMLFSRDFTFLS
ncbi:hypothetical protein BH09CHL1_BH09CHL1_24120 [soil metagenome]